jgi:sugar phosphate isomerase/epimerase
MEIGICSYSFHRQLAAGTQDIFKYIGDCRELGCTQLDPWNRHLAGLKAGDADVTDPAAAALSADEEEYLEQVEEAADASGLPWGTLVVDGAHIYEPDELKRQANRARAYRWLEVAGKLGFEQVRIDAGGPEDMPEDAFAIIVDGYNDLIARARPMGIEILTENHFGPTVVPRNVAKLCDTVAGLGLLFDTQNWKPELRDDGRRACAKYARATHVKTFEWDAAGNETSGTKLEEAIGTLIDAGYKGVWGVESVPKDGDEYAGAKRTIELVRRIAG